MSGFEIERIQERISGMTHDQQMIVAESLPDDVLWGAVYERFLNLRNRETVIIQAVNG